MRELAYFVFELGQLKRVQRSGWWAAGIREAESVAEHSFRVIALAYLLASLVEEEVDAERAVAMSIFHDLAETRTNDLHGLASRYFANRGEVEERVVTEQTTKLPEPLPERLQNLLAEYEAGSSLEAKIARDADRLECLLEAREYAELYGEQTTREWVESSRARLLTSAARELAAECERVRPSDWWRRLERGNG